MARNGNGNGRVRRRGRRTRASRSSSPMLPFWAKALIALGIMGLTGVIVAAGVGYAVYQSYADELVAPDELAINKPSFGAKIYDRNGNLLYEYVDDQAGLRRPIALENVSDAFLAATISTEDDSFFTNPGVNYKGLARAAWENFSPLSDTPGVLEGSGGSSITQQLVKNVYIPPEERLKQGAEGLNRKLRETVYAIELTRRYSKEQILEWYINQISYGGVYNGVQAAALGYFGKTAAELTLAEAALLAGIPQSPSAYDPVNHPEAAKERRDEILDLMQRQGEIQIGEEKFFTVTPEALAAAKAEEISISERRFPIKAPHFVLQYVQPQLELLFNGPDALFRDGLVVTTSLDLELQDKAAEIMEGWITEFEEISASKNGALMIMNPATGEILTMIGSRDYFREDIEGKNNNATACNSPGSSFKPFAYVTAFKELGWGPGTVILDTPVTYFKDTPDEFTPRNPSNNFQGPITIRNALGNSLNIPANKAAAAVGPQKIVTQARELGFLKTFRTQDRGGCSQGGGYGPAIATGGVDITLEEMMIGYSVLARGGVMNGQTPFGAHGDGERTIDPIAILEVRDAKGNVIYDVKDRLASEQVIEPEYPYLIWDILSDPSSQCITFTCGGISIPGYKAGVKTGTSEPFDPLGPNARKIGETWAFGFAPDLVVGIWAGNSDNSPIDHIYSTSISFRAMRDTFIMAHEGIEVTAYARPEKVVEEEVCVPSGMRPSELCGKTTKDLFVKDRLPEDEDTWWQRVKIDRRNNLLASPLTPRQFVVEEVMLVLPEELLKTEEDRKRADEWAKALGVPLAPTEISTAGGSVTGGGGGGGGGTLDLAAIITSPEAGEAISGNVNIRGRAASDDFIAYHLQYGAGVSPGAWVTIESSTDAVENGSLGHWDVRDLQPGVYTLRLLVLDGARGQLVTTVQVVVE